MNHNGFNSESNELYDIRTHVRGPEGILPITEAMLRQRPSGDLFGLSQNAGMGWDPGSLNGNQYLILSTHGGIRKEDGTPVALGYHTGHWEVGLLVEAAAQEFKRAGAVPFAASCTDPCDGRSQGTTAMFDSLPYRNDAANVFKRLIRSLPTRRGVMGVATCDKGLPAMMMALAAMRNLPSILVPGGVTLLPEEGEDAGRIQTIGVRFVHGLIPIEKAAELGCRACASPGGGCQFLGTAATSQVVGESLGMSLGHSALAPSGHPIWLEMARRSARALLDLEKQQTRMRDILTEASVTNAMLVHAAFGGSTNLVIHLPAIAHAAGLRRPDVQDWIRINRQVPRLVDALPNGPRNHPTIQVFMAGGVPEVMLHLRELGLLDLDARTVSGCSIDEQLNEWQDSERRHRLRKLLKDREQVNPDDVIVSPSLATSRGLKSTVCFPHGNLAPEGSLIKSTAIDPSVVDPDGVFRRTGPAKIFLTEPDAIKALKERQIEPGQVVVLICRGPSGAGMEETYQLTSALKYLPFGKGVVLLTDARFSGVSTGACIGHISPEALAGGPIGKLIDGDLIEVIIDQNSLEGSINFVGEAGVCVTPTDAARILASRPLRADLAADPALPPETRLWAMLQNISGGSWGGCVFDVEAILQVITKGMGVEAKL
jgi:putative YjhG/YagF family dehydratase